MYCVLVQDALVLMKATLERKQQLIADSGAAAIPDVRAAVQEMMTNLFISVINHTVSVVCSLDAQSIFTLYCHRLQLTV